MVAVRVALVAVAALLLGGCAGGSGSAPQSSLDGAWTLTRFTDAAGPARLLTESPITLTIATDHAGGRASCNSYGVDLGVSGDAIAPTMLSQTEMACVDPYAMELEARYLAALAASTAISGGDELVLTGPSIELTFERDGPEPAPSSSSDPPSIEGNWTLESLVQTADADDPDAAMSRPPAMTMTFDGGSFSMTPLDCLDLSGTYAFDGSVLAIGEIRDGSTADCVRSPAPGLRDLLDSDPVVTIAGDSMAFDHSEGRVTATFTRS